MTNETVEFGVVGAGWRSDFFLHVARELPGLSVAGVVVRDPDRAGAVNAEWDVPVFGNLDELARQTKPRFVIASVSAEAMPDVCLEIASHGLPVLAETPPATDLDGLVRLYDTVTNSGVRIQVAEQYWAQPLHAARQAIVDSGVIGPVNQVHLSVCHGYHGMSLIRRLLGVLCEPAEIVARPFTGRVIEGPGRDGPPAAEAIVDVTTDYAWLDFGDRFGVYEFCVAQYRNWIRGQRVNVRGERGEIIDDRVTTLSDPVTPITATLQRHEAGRNGNLEGFHLKGIQYGDEWVYRNPFVPARFSDEEIAVAECLVAMAKYVDTGEAFYSLAEASQDQYLALACGEAAASGRAVRTVRQPWADQT